MPEIKTLIFLNILSNDNWDSCYVKVTELPFFPQKDDKFKISDSEHLKIVDSYYDVKSGAVSATLEDINIDKIMLKNTKAHLVDVLGFEPFGINVGS